MVTPWTVDAYNRREGLEQEVFELQLLSVQLDRARVVCPRGTCLEVLCPPGPLQLRSKQVFQRKFLIKDLGIQARQILGLPGYTQTWQTTRVLHQGVNLPMHLPLLALCPRYYDHEQLKESCTFCECQLVNRGGKVGPYQYCWFCGDSPATHHGACCPHNPEALAWNGTPHRQQHFRHVRNFLNSLPF